MRVIICGSREWTNEQVIEDRILRLIREEDNYPLIAQGGCRGADQLADRVQSRLVSERRLCISGVTYTADWDKHGRAAGPIRNQRMIDAGADLVLAFTNDLGKSRGTADMVRRAKKAGVRVEVIGELAGRCEP